MALLLDLVEIRGHKLKISATLPLPADDLSGNSSYTDTAETGDKPKKLNVSMQILYKQTQNLVSLITLAEAKDETGSRKVYNLLNPTAAAMNIRQCRFEGDVTVKEDDSLELWSVMFKLTEVASVPEKKAAREQQQAVTDQTATGDTVAETSTESDTAIPEEQELTSFESVLAWIDGVFDDGDSGAA